jgi:hypothetical protein
MPGKMSNPPNGRTTPTLLDKSLDYFVPVIERSEKTRVKVTHRWETMKVWEVPTKGAGNAWEDWAIGMAIQFPMIAPQFWSSFAWESHGGSLLLVERPGHAPYLVSKARIDSLHADGPAYGGMVEQTNPVAFDDDPNQGYLLQLIESDVEMPEGWDNDELIERVHELLGGFPFDQAAYNEGLLQLPEVRAVMVDFKAGKPLTPPWVRWTYGQTIILAKTIDLLLEAQDSGERKEHPRTFEVAVETVLQGFNNHY